MDPERADRDLTNSRPDIGLGLAESLRVRGSGLNNNNSLSNVDIPTLKENLEDDFKYLANRIGALELVSYFSLLLSLSIPEANSFSSLNSWFNRLKLQLDHSIERKKCF